MLFSNFDNNVTCFKLHFKLSVLDSKTGVGKLRPATGKSVAREYVFFLNGMRPAEENFVAREHVNVARRAKNSKVFFCLVI